ncbi:MAG: hypothetical protein FWC64_08275 [Treponema sp.]|nr:hypothetical protein [Treponema sp.]
MGNDYIISNAVENLFNNRIVAEENKLHKREEEAEQKENTRELAKKYAEIIGKNVFPCFVSFVNLLTSKKIECSFSDNSEMIFSENIKHDPQKSPNIKVVDNFESLVGEGINPSGTIPCSITSKVPALSNLKVGESILISGGYEKTLLKRQTGYLKIVINGGYHDREGVSFSGHYDDSPIYLYLKLEFSLSIVQYPNTKIEIEIASDQYFDPSEYRKAFASSVEFWNRTHAYTDHFGRPLPQELQRPYDPFCNREYRQEAASAGKIKVINKINIQDCNKDFIDKKLYGWLDILVRNRLLE